VSSRPVHTYYGKVLFALDVLLCTLIWRDSGVSISSMCELQLEGPQPARWAVVLGWILNHIEANHTKLAVIDDIARAQNAIAILLRQVKP
jgi:hypothetical protein